jgi:hypothetical protein
MRTLLASVLTVAIGLSLAFLTSSFRTADAAPGRSAEPMLSHDVYFALNDNSPEAKHKLVEACKKHLTKHSGTVFFAAGVREESLKRDVNDHDFDVALHIVFKNKAAHDKYQDAPRHKQFVDENKESFKKVRVFDSTVTE